MNKHKLAIAIGFGMVVTFLILLLTQGTIASGRALVYGDANQDGVTNMGDVIKIERLILGIDVLGPFDNQVWVCADLSRNGRFDMGDVVKLERHILGIDKIPTWWTY